MAEDLYPNDFSGYNYGGDSVDASYPSDFAGYNYGNVYAGYQDWGGADYLAGSYPQIKSGGGVTFSGENGTPETQSSWLNNLQPFTTQSSGGSMGGGGSSGGKSSGGGSSGTILKTSYLGGKTLPVYNLPLYDYNRINFLTGQQAAPGYSKLSNALYTGIGKVAATDNPYMQGQARKQLLTGYGGGISEVAAGAAKTAEQLYGQEYSGKMTEASAMFQAAMQDWMKSMTTITTNEPYSGSLYPGGYNQETDYIGGVRNAYGNVIGSGNELNGVRNAYGNVIG